MNSAIYVMCGKRVRRALFAILLCAGMPGGSLAALVSASDLFLAPALVPEDDYATTGRTFSTPAESLSLSFSPGSHALLPAGGSIVGAHILPLLNPNPATAMGEYSSADLAAITSGNYASYFFRLPGTHYAADLTGGVLTVDFHASGQYFVGVDYVFGGAASTVLYHVEVNDFFGGDGAADKAAVSRKIDGPTTDFNIVSTTPAGDNKYADNAAMEIAGRLGAGRVARAGTLAEACAKIKAASEKAGKKLSVSLVGHGRPGSIRIGTERINNDGDGVMTPKQFQDCIDEFVSKIEFWSCNTAQDAAGTQFLRDFAESIGSASGFTVTTTAAQTYWDTVAGVRGLDTITASVAEPGALLLVLLGYSLLILSRPGSGSSRHAPFRSIFRVPPPSA